MKISSLLGTIVLALSSRRQWGWSPIEEMVLLAMDRTAGDDRAGGDLVEHT
jgi:hypothetical protein